MTDTIPAYDDAGLNLADPHDKRGHKTHYITRLQVEALRQLLPDASGTAIDVGCGYGRMSAELISLGYDHVIGIDPSARVLETAKRLNPTVDFLEGALPNLPIPAASANTLFLLNVLRSLHIMGMLEIASGITESMTKGGKLIVLDNLRNNHPAYIPEDTILDLFQSKGLRLLSRTAVRGARWPWIFPITLGWIPRSWHKRIAQFEIAWMRRYWGRPRVQYHNVIWIFEKP